MAFHSQVASVFGMSTGLDYKPPVPLTADGAIDYDSFNKNAQFVNAMKEQKAALEAATLAARAATEAAARATSEAAAAAKSRPKVDDSGGPNPFLKAAGVTPMSELVQIVDGKVNINEGMPAL